ncbi:hypothetical protein [Nocardia rhizosphaerae]|uniref:Lipoprotein n=1 Tax=Nocardia rhizosphaerae TaxID=1691571 RepID=A0ABV8KYQ2_9NOCA
MTVRGRLCGLVLVALTALAGCASSSGPARQISASPVRTSAPPAEMLDQAQQRNERIRGMLYTAGCVSNACVQTYFACMDGYLTGDACQFYRDHPPPP